ncbi:ATP-dependent helicase [Ferroacidibacillus organovorans]|nr:UvrD-helicase domain-containing protein [Ferroacidibacillus organovorans]
MPTMTKQLDADQLLASLNDPQREAVVTTDGPLLLLAGAGSGKTSVMTRRIAYLTNVKKLDPWNILAITFTNKAAREMNERVRQWIGDAADDMWMCTFHAMCVKILRREARHLDFTPTFTILDADDQASMIKQCMLDLNHDIKKYDPASVQWIISAAKNELLTPATFVATGTRPVDTIVRGVFAAYDHQLRRANALDFDDLIGKTVLLFETFPDVLKTYQEKFLYIHVDEYQDTNRAQYQLIRMLSKEHHNVCVVGDADQAIYRWRGADRANLDYFERDFPTRKMIKLEQNYRSTDTILKAANAVIQNNQNRVEKSLWSTKGTGEKIAVYAAQDAEDEAIYALSKIQAHVGEGGRFSDCTVLYRANAQSRAVEDVLLQAAIPYHVVGGMTFYDRREIKDVMAYLRAIANPQDEISLLRIINVPKRSIGEGSIRKLLDYAHDEDLTLMDAIKRAKLVDQLKSAEQVARFAEMIEHLQERMIGATVTEFLHDVLRTSGYREMYAQSSKEEDRTRLENIDELDRITRSFDRRRRGTVLDFLAETSLMTDVDRNENDERDAMRLMTVHASKGLEFPVVFVLGVEETVFPHSRSLDTIDGVEEERNLFYVAVTRAKDKLHLSYCLERSTFGQVHMNDPSRFLQEIPEEYTERTGADPVQEARFEIGMTVRHPQYGVGVVTDLSGVGEEQMLTITFRSKYGTKEIVPRITRLRVLG